MNPKSEILNLNPKPRNPKPISGYNATRNTKLSPEVKGDPRTKMQIPKPKNQKRTNPKPISGYNATRNTKLSAKVNGDPRSNMQIPKPKP